MRQWDTLTTDSNRRAGVPECADVHASSRGNWRMAMTLCATLADSAPGRFAAWRPGVRRCPAARGCLKPEHQPGFEGMHEIGPRGIKTNPVIEAATMVGGVGERPLRGAGIGRALTQREWDALR